jgi:hypothetical protein
MRKHEREVRRILAAIAEENEAMLVRIEYTGRTHLRAVFVKGRVTATITIPNSPSDVRAYRNIVADAKRVLQQIEQRGGAV